MKRFERFHFVSGLATQANENQVKTLIYKKGVEAEDVLVSLHLIAQEASEYETGKGRLDNHFVARRNVIFEQAKFNQGQQEAGESIDGFHKALHCLAELCGYGTLHDEMVRERFVVGLRDKRLSEQLRMDAKLMLDKALNKARQSELVKK